MTTGKQPITAETPNSTPRHQHRGRPGTLGAAGIIFSQACTSSSILARRDGGHVANRSSHMLRVLAGSCPPDARSIRKCLIARLVCPRRRSRSSRWRSIGDRLRPSLLGSSWSKTGVSAATPTTSIPSPDATLCQGGGNAHLVATLSDSAAFSTREAREAAGMSILVGNRPTSTRTRLR